MTIENKDNLTILHLKENAYLKRKSLFAILFGFYFVTTYFALLQFLPLLSWENIYGSIIVLIVFTLYFAFSFALLNHTVSSEKIILGDGILILEKTSLLKSTSQSFEIEHIKNLRFKDNLKPLADHPLKGNTIDYFGFEASDKLAANANRNDSVFFDYEERVVSFGKRLYSWDFEKIYELIYKKTFEYE